MKKFWKIFGITLGSLIGIILLAVVIVVYVVFTPKRLTPIVRNVADQFISAPHEIGEVDLTFFSTFPEFGLRAKGLYIINPMEGAQSDTLLAAPEVVAKVDVMRFLNDKALDVHALTLKDVTANIFFNEQGENNLDVFILPNDTTEEDTTAFSLPFNELNVQELELKANRLSYLDKKNHIDAVLNNTTLEASANGFEDIFLRLIAADANATIGEEKYADHVQVALVAPNTDFSLDSMRVILHNAILSVNEFEVGIDGMAGMPDDIVVDARVKAENWNIPDLLKLLPQSITSLLDGIDIDAASAWLNADIKGVYNDSTMPLIDADLTLKNGKASYMEVFPYKINDINLGATAHVDLNGEANSAVQINKLHARVEKTTLDATGSLKDLLGDMLCDVRAKANVNLPDFRRYLESDGINTDLKGNAKGTVAAKIRLSALQKMQLQKGVISGNLDLTDLHLTYDSMLVDIPATNLTFRIPNQNPTKKSVGWIDATLKPTAVGFEMIDFLRANLDNSTIRLEASDVLNNSDFIYANLALETANLKAEMDSMGGTIRQPELMAYVEYDSKTENAIPLVDAALDFADLQGSYTDINGHLTQSSLTASLSGSRKDKSQPRAKVTLSTNSLKANVGEDVKAQTGKLSLTAKARRDPSKENLLLQWNPQLSIDLNDGVADLSAFGEQIQIPQITFDYSNKVFNISKSEIIIGKSDFSLVGEVRNIGNWLDKTGNLEGELSFTSDYTDVNELMDLLSAEEGTEEEPAPKTDTAVDSSADKTESDPFLVPKDVDLTLNTHIKQAAVFDQMARDLGGKLYVKDGILVLEEMGFICKAAKLQLTAMYRTPRRNHLYVGLDYHMLDINIEELINMIPQIDTMMPMLRSFRGAAEFHIAAETYLNSKYELKTSTTRGACSIEGKDLVLLDGETFTQIAKILMFNKKTENKVDSISAQFTIYKDEIDIYPFCLSIDNYMAAAGGHHNLDMSFDYHISLLKPLYIGVDVNGTFDDLHIKPAKCRYAQDFRPIIHKDVETQNASLKKLINEALKRSVKIE